MENNILNELKREAKKDIISNFFIKNKKNILYIITSAIIVIIFYGIFSFFNKISQDKYSQKLHQSLIYEEAKDLDNTKKELEEIINATFAPSGVKSLAEMRMAGLLLSLNKKEESLKLYIKISNSIRYDDFIQELASVLASRIISEKISKNTEAKDFDESLKTLDKLAGKNKILKEYVLEQKAIALIKKERNDEANSILAKINTNKELSQSLKARINDLSKISNYK